MIPQTLKSIHNVLQDANLFYGMGIFLNQNQCEKKIVRFPFFIDRFQTKEKQTFLSILFMIHQKKKANSQRDIEEITKRSKKNKENFGSRKPKII